MYDVNYKYKMAAIKFPSLCYYHSKFKCNSIIMRVAYVKGFTIYINYYVYVQLTMANKAAC